MEQLRMLYLSGSSGDFNEISEAIAIREKATAKQLEEAKNSLETGFLRIRDLFPRRDHVKWWAVELRIAFDSDWKPLLTDDIGKPLCGYKDPFRMVPDFVYIDRAGVLHIEDDKALYPNLTRDQVKLYGFGMCQYIGWKMSGRKDDFKPFIPSIIICRYNLLGQGKTEEMRFTYPEVKEIPDQVAGWINPILATKDFLPVVGKSCDYCGFIPECPKHEKVRQNIKAAAAPVPGFAIPNQITTKVDAEKLGLWILCGSKLISEGKKLLQGFIEGSGALEIPGTGKEFRFSPEKVWEADLNKTIEALEAEGIERALIMKKLGANWKGVHAVIKAATPMGGKGITKDIKYINLNRRNALIKKIYSVGEEKPRKRGFGAFNK